MRRIAAAKLSRGSGALFGPVLGLMCGLLVPVLPAQAQADVVVTISKSQQRLAVTVDGTELYRWPVSTGRRGLETPSGAFRPIRLERKWYSSKYDGSPMPYSIFFHGGYAVHGTYEKRRLGRPVSHGCVRLLPSHAATLFSLVRREGKGNARIVVMNGPLPQATDVVPIADIRKPQPAPSPKQAPKPAPKHETVAKVAPRAAPPDIAVPLPPAFKPRFTEAAKAPVKPPVAAPRSAPAKTVAAIPVPPPRHVKPRTAAPRVVHARTDDNFVAVGNDAAVMRGREAWLRSLDRKYGITH